jgi:predicted acylesterase/phospholipase RssA
MALVGGINSDGREEICALGTNGVVWHSWNTIENATGGAPNIGILKPWAPWTLIGTSSFSGIGIGSDQTGRLELFGVSSGQVYQVWEAFPGVDTFIGSAQVGIVLGGGGTMADFQVGALRYLSNHGMQGTIWAGTSMGALNALVLAQGQTNSQDQLEALWLGLRLPSDILLEQPWLAQSPAWIRNIVESFSNGWNFVSVQVPGTVLPYLPALNSVVNNVGNALSVPALIADLEGLTDAIAQTAGDVGTVLSLISTLVGALLPSGGSQQLTDLGNLYDNMAANASIYSPTSSFIEQVFSLVSAGVPSGIAVLIAVTNLDDGQIYYVGGDGTILTLQDGELSPSSIPSTNAPPAVLASMSFPVILPAMTLGNSDFVDGSLRESLPIDAAIAQGANQIYVISGIASVVGAQTPGFYNLSNQTQIGGLIGMHVRAMTITSSAIQQYSLRSLPADGTLIQPSFNLHGPFVIDPGLMSIAMAYGHMRAGEIINLGSNAGPLSSLSDQIAVLRLRIWGLENQAMADLANAANPPVLDPRESESDTLVPTGDSSVIPLIRQAKEALRNLVCQYQTMSGYTDELPSIDFRSSAEIATIVGLPSPFNGTDSQAWWMQWERHQYTPNSNTPWDTFIAGDGTSVGPAQPPSPC